MMSAGIRVLVENPAQCSTWTYAASWLMRPVLVETWATVFDAAPASNDRAMQSSNSSHALPRRRAGTRRGRIARTGGDLMQRPGDSTAASYAIRYDDASERQRT